MARVIAYDIVCECGHVNIINVEDTYLSADVSPCEFGDHVYITLSIYSKNCAVCGRAIEDIMLRDGY